MSQTLVGCSHAASTVDCGDPNNATSEVIVHYTTTRVGSMIFYQCGQSGFAPSSSSAVCMGSGRWSPDPSQVVCRMVTTTITSTSTMSTPTGGEITVALLTETSCYCLKLCIVMLQWSHFYEWWDH